MSEIPGTKIREQCYVRFVATGIYLIWRDWSQDLKKHHDIMESIGDLESENLDLIQARSSCYSSLTLDFLILKTGVIILALPSS